jgi:glycosyltransferase involved in cell wall biosynthesis
MGPDRRIFIANCSGDTFTTDRSGAIAIHTWQVARAARRAGYEPVVLTRRGSGMPLALPDLQFVRWPEPTTRLGRRVQRHAYQVGGKWLPTDHEIFATRLEKRIQSYPPPHRVLFGNDPEVIVHVRKRLPEARLVHVFHNVLPMSDELRERLVASADALAAVSAFTANECAEAYGADVTVAHNGVDLEQFKPRPGHIHSDEPLIGFTGTFSPVKGLDLLLDALTDLRRTGGRFRLRLVGDFYWGMEGVQEYAAEIERQLATLRAAGVNVDLVGRLSRDDLIARSAEVDIAVIPSRWNEPFALVLAEAMACGSAVIAANVGGMPEVLGDAGLYFERDDQSSLVAQLRRLVEDGDLRTSLGRRAETRARGFTWDATWSSLRPLLFPDTRLDTE